MTAKGTHPHSSFPSPPPTPLGGDTALWFAEEILAQMKRHCPHLHRWTTTAPGLSTPDPTPSPGSQIHREGSRSTERDPTEKLRVTNTHNPSLPPQMLSELRPSPPFSQLSRLSRPSSMAVLGPCTSPRLDRGSSLRTGHGVSTNPGTPGKRPEGQAFVSLSPCSPQFAHGPSHSALPGRQVAPSAVLLSLPERTLTWHLGFPSFCYEMRAPRPPPHCTRSSCAIYPAVPPAPRGERQL